jgi:PKD repeat protein
VFCLNTPIYFESILTNSPSSSSANDSCLWYTIDSTLYNTSVQYHWDFGDGNTSNAQHPMHSYSNSGSYTVTLEVTSDCQCPSTYSLNIVINSTVGPNLSSCSSVICEGDTVSYCTDATSPFWNIDGGSLYASTATDPCVEVIWDNNNNSLNDGAGLLEITDLSSNCLAASPHEIAVIPLNPVIKGPTNPCAGSFEEYSFAAIPGVNYYWGISGWGASIVNGGGTNKILVHWNQSGNFTVNLYMSSSVACPTTNSSKSVQVKPTLWTNTA